MDEKGNHGKGRKWSAMIREKWKGLHTSEDLKPVPGAAVNKRWFSKLIRLSIAAWVLFLVMSAMLREYLFVA